MIVRCTFHHLSSTARQLTKKKQTGWPWETYARPQLHPHSQHSPVSTDPLPGWHNPTTRSPTNLPLLRAPPKDQRHSSFRCRHHPHPPSLAIDRFPCRDLWHLYTVWRVLQDDSWICVQHPSGGTIPCQRSAKGRREGWRGKQEQGSACLADTRACALSEILRDTSTVSQTTSLLSRQQRKTAGHGTKDTMNFTIHDERQLKMHKFVILPCANHWHEILVMTERKPARCKNPCIPKSP